MESEKYFADYIDDEIIDFVTNIRKMSLRRDLRRHKFAILLIKLRLKPGYFINDIPWLSEWASRLKKIIDNGHTHHTGR